MAHRCPHYLCVSINGYPRTIVSVFRMLTALPKPGGTTSRSTTLRSDTPKTLKTRFDAASEFHFEIDMLLRPNVRSVPWVEAGMLWPTYGEVLRPGEFRRISAGSGIAHSEFNPSPEVPVHFYQIWLVPNVRDIQPSYQQREFGEAEKLNRLRLVSSPDGEEGSLSIHTDAKVYLSKLESGNEIAFELIPGRHGWLQVLSGSVGVSGNQLSTSDGAAITNEDLLSIVASEDAEIMLFDLA